MKNQGSDLLIFNCSRGRLGIKVLVICASIYRKNFAEGFNAMLKSKLVNSV